MDIQSFVLKKDSNYFQQPVPQSDGSYKNLCWGAEKSEPKSGQLITLTECDEGTVLENKGHYRKDLCITYVNLI